MAIQFKDLLSYSVKAIDGHIGSIDDILFDDSYCKIRYIVLDTLKWFPGNKVLLAPESISMISQENQEIIFDLDRETIKESPPLDSDLPVSRQYEEILHQYHGWAPYWSVSPFGGAWFPYPSYKVPYSPTRDSIPESRAEEWIAFYQDRKGKFDQHLRSCNEICGYGVITRDNEEFGKVVDLIIEINQWLLLDLILSDHKWLPGGKKVTCSPMFINEIDESDRKLKLSLPKNAIADSPEYRPKKYGENHRKLLLEHYLENMALSKGVSRSSNSRLSKHP